ncbi:MAG: amino acid ABC transporter permease [Candidatus Odyssella sp.]|nr:amino acid ABC transporter permease [Candidatus Odyssella sp.]
MSRPFAVLLPFRPGDGLAGIAGHRADRRAAAGLALAAGLILVHAAAHAATAGAKPAVLETLWRWTPFLLGGFVWNIVISALAMAVGTALGFLLGIAQISQVRAVRAPSWFATQLLRNAPWLVLLFYCMYLLPFQLHVFGTRIGIPDWLKAAFGFALPVMAYVSEIVRGAIRSIPAGQWESAEALSFTRSQTIWMIVIPQCLKRMLPAWMNLYAIVTMASVLANVVGVSEGLTAAREMLAAEQRVELLLPVYAYVLLWFFAYCYPIARATVFLERRWAVAH